MRILPLSLSLSLSLLGLVLQMPMARLVAAQAPDTGLSGTWVINLTKSNFGTLPRPTVDSSVITRSGSMYHIQATSDIGGQGLQHLSYTWPVGDGETTVDLPNGATMHTKITHARDTAAFASDVSVQGQTVALQSGRMYRSRDGASLTRDVTIQPVAGPSVEPIHFVLVYDRR